MIVTCEWTGKSSFLALSEAFKIPMDAAKPIGDASAPTPKQLVLAALCGCTGMDVAALLKKNKQQVATFKITADGTVSSSHPTEFKVIQLRFDITGECDQDQIMNAIELSQTRFCAVSGKHFT